MANDQGKTGQQGGNPQTTPGNVPNDREKASQPGQQGGQGSGTPDQDDPQRAGGGTQQGGKGGHRSGPKSDKEQSDMDDASQTVQDEDSSMNDDNR